MPHGSGSGGVLKFIFFLAILLLCSSVGGAQLGAEDYSLDGVAVQMGEKFEEQSISQIESTLEGTGFEKPTNAVLYVEYGGEQYILFSYEEIKTSKISGSGDLLLESSSDSKGVIIADDIETSTDGVGLSIEEYREHRNDMAWEFVEVTGGVRTVSYTVDPGNKFVQQHSTISIGDSGSLSPILSQPGRQGRWATLNLSDNEYGHSQSREIVSKTRVRGTPTLGMKFDGVQWWVSSEATVSGVIMASDDGEAKGLAVREVAPDAIEISGPAEARSHVDEIVTFSANGIGSRISSQETLLAAKKCAPSSITNPATGCLPIPADSVLHSGAMYSKSSNSADDVILYVGATNRKQSQPVQDEHGRYQVTGRVVEASEIDPRLEGYGIIVYDRERVGDINSNPAFARESANTVKNHLQEQIKADQSDWESIKSEQADPEEINSETATSSPTETDTPSENPEIHIESKRLGLTTIEPDQSTAVVIKLENDGGPGTEQLTFTANGDQFHSESVRVRDDRTIRVGFTPESGSGLYRIAVNGEPVGEVTVEDDPGEETNDSRGPIEKLALGYGGLVVGSGAFFGIVIGFLKVRALLL